MEREQSIESPDALVDAYGRIHDYLRISLTDRCNLRCDYCMPKHPLFLPHTRLLTAAEIELLVSVFASMGIKKIRLTGGEPLIRSDFPTIVKSIAQHAIPIHLTTNGTYIHKHFDLITRHFSSLNMSLDTLRRDRFKHITHRNAFDRTLANLESLLAIHFPVKINVVVIRDVNHDEILDFIRLTLEHPVEVRFIEFMPFKGNGWNQIKSYAQEEMLQQIRAVFPIVNLGQKAQQTASRYRVPGAPGSFGIISTVSKPFCESCNRIRITADGKLKNCLFGLKEYDLKPLLLSRSDLKKMLSQALLDKKMKYGGNIPLLSLKNSSSYFDNRSMTAIGG